MSQRASTWIIKRSQTSKWIFFITGPTACGKTTVAKYLSEKLSLAYIEGDDYHPKANVEKMAHGHPLSDEDRKNWLEVLRDESEHPRGGNLHVIVTCSALKRQYRDVLREAANGTDNVLLRFVYLSAPESVLRDRAKARKGHFAGAELVHSQFQILEPPAADEKDVITIDASGSVESTEDSALQQLDHLLRKQ
ncbi:shikimate kinase [Xylariales sp. PMI_506]|nr:shikimate kinase [Xylariales sp. PMI_506]